MVWPKGLDQSQVGTYTKADLRQVATWTSARRHEKIAAQRFHRTGSRSGSVRGGPKVLPIYISVPETGKRPDAYAWPLIFKRIPDDVTCHSNYRVRLVVIKSVAARLRDRIHTHGLGPQLVGQASLDSTVTIKKPRGPITTLFVH